MKPTDPAFPLIETQITDYHDGSAYGSALPHPIITSHGGVNVRTYIATAALQGLVASPSCPSATDDDAEWVIHKVVEEAVCLADTLIAALARQETSSDAK